MDEKKVWTPEQEAHEEEAYNNYLKSIHKFGGGIMIAIMLVTWLAPLYVFAKGGFPGGKVLAGTVAAMLVQEGWSWFTEPLMWLPILGIPGLYLGYTAGNIGSMRAPVSFAAMNNVGAVKGSKKGDAAGMFGMITSVFVNLVFLLIVIFLGSWLLKVLPDVVTGTFNYASPAIQGAGTLLLLKMLFPKKAK